MEFVRYISISVRDSKANSYSHSSHHHMALYRCAFFSLFTFSLYGYFFFVCSFILSCYLRVYRFNNNEKKNCISFNAIVFLIIISRNLAHDSFHTTRTFGLDCVFFYYIECSALALYGPSFFSSKCIIQWVWGPCMLYTVLLAIDFNVSICILNALPINESKQSAKWSLRSDSRYSDFVHANINFIVWFDFGGFHINIILLLYWSHKYRHSARQ